MTRRRLIWILGLAVWASALLAAALADRSVASWVHQTQLLRDHPWLVKCVKSLGDYRFTLAVAVLVLLLHAKRWMSALPLVISGPLVGLCYLLIKWAVGRRRPVKGILPFDFHPFAHGFAGLVHAESGLSFPSGHAAMAFATATCLAMAMPRWAVLFFAGATAVAAERVLENAHYLSDVVAGAGVGVLCGLISVRLCVGGRPTPAFEVIAKAESSRDSSSAVVRTWAGEP